MRNPLDMTVSEVWQSIRSFVPDAALVLGGVYWLWFTEGAWWAVILAFAGFTVAGFGVWAECRKRYWRKRLRERDDELREAAYQQEARRRRIKKQIENAPFN